MYLATAPAALAAAPADGTGAPPAASTELPAVAVQAAALAEPTVGYRPRTSETASGIATKISDIPQSVAVVSSSVMQDQQARTLDDVLGNVSGITQTNTLGGTRDAFIKRGFGS
ncbi:TonB-dependent siderophore receptor, partial [Mesorhizobium sp. M3A.F.Ca.ET.174.01.1.1]